jgi:metal iron transporter
VALLAAGQSSSLIATVAGQAVSQGFLNFRFVSPALRRLITRCIGLIPSMVVALAVGRRGIDAMLVASQVALSIVLPFISLPLLILTGSKEVMTVRKADGEEVDYSNGWIMTIIGYSIWSFIVIANIYSWYTLAQGDV